MNKTFAELGYNVGDTVRCVDEGSSGFFDEGSTGFYETGKEYVIDSYRKTPAIDGLYNGFSASWELVSRAGLTDADDGYPIWGDMTPEAQGALLLAEHNGAVVQEWNNGWKLWQITDCSSRDNDTKYRVKPADPVVVTHELSGHHEGIWAFVPGGCDTHTITYNMIDGVIDCASVQMMEINSL